MCMYRGARAVYKCQVLDGTRHDPNGKIVMMANCIPSASPPPLSWWRPKGSFSHSNPSQQRGQRTHWPDVILGLVSFVPTWQSAAEVASSDVHFPPWLRCRRWTISGQRQNREHGGGCMLKKHARGRSSNHSRHLDAAWRLTTYTAGQG